MSAACWTTPASFGRSAELGKADQGGGGTVAMFMAKRNIDTLDARRARAVHARPL